MSVEHVERVDVPGGRLAVEIVEGTTAHVLAIHGISSQRRLWDWLRTAAPDLSLVAPDLRGRGDSVDVSGPSSMARHASDMVAVLDALGVDRVHVCGMSMGGFIAVDLAVRFPERVTSLVLIDGGFPLPAPPGLTPELVPTVFADRLGRLERRWPNVDDYLDFFVSATAPLLDRDDPRLRRYLEHDLVDGRVRLSKDVFLDDAVDVFFGTQPWQEVKAPTRLAFAEWSTGTGSAPAYTHDAVAGIEAALPALVSTRFVPGVDHAGSIMSDPGASAAADLLGEALAAF